MGLSRSNSVQHNKMFHAQNVFPPKKVCHNATHLNEYRVRLDIVEMDFGFPYFTHILHDDILFLSKMPPRPLGI